MNRNDLEKICELAEEVMDALCTAEERWNYMTLTGDKAFRQNILTELWELPTERIKSEFLSGFLPEGRSALRATRDFALEGIPDSLLDEIFTLTWLGKVRWWASLRELVEKNGTGEEGT